MVHISQLRMNMLVTYKYTHAYTIITSQFATVYLLRNFQDWDEIFWAREKIERKISLFMKIKNRLDHWSSVNGARKKRDRNLKSISLGVFIGWGFFLAFLLRKPVEEE